MNIEWKSLWRRIWHPARRALSDGPTAPQTKAKRLAEIARERDALKSLLQKNKRQKKAVAPIYKALKALATEEMALEMGK